MISFLNYKGLKYRIFKNETEETSLDIISKYYFKKGSMVSNRESDNGQITIDVRDVDDENDVRKNSVVFTASSTHNYSLVQEVHVINMESELFFSRDNLRQSHAFRLCFYIKTTFIKANFFKENVLYRFLNAPNSLVGKIILGK